MVAPSDVEQAWEAIDAQIARRDPLDLAAHPLPTSLAEWTARASLAVVFGVASLWTFTLLPHVTNSTAVVLHMSGTGRLRSPSSSPQRAGMVALGSLVLVRRLGGSLVGAGDHGDRLSTPLNARVPACVRLVGTCVSPPDRAHSKYSVFGFVRRSVDDFAAFICADRGQAVAPCL